MSQGSVGQEAEARDGRREIEPKKAAVLEPEPLVEEEAPAAADKLQKAQAMKDAGVLPEGPYLVTGGLGGLGGDLRFFVPPRWPPCLGALARYCAVLLDPGPPAAG